MNPPISPFAKMLPQKDNRNQIKVVTLREGVGEGDARMATFSPDQWTWLPPFNPTDQPYFIPIFDTFIHGINLSGVYYDNDVETAAIHVAKLVAPTTKVISNSNDIFLSLYFYANNLTAPAAPVMQTIGVSFDPVIFVPSRTILGFGFTQGSSPGGVGWSIGGIANIYYSFAA